VVSIQIGRKLFHQLRFDALSGRSTSSWASRKHLSARIPNACQSNSVSAPSHTVLRLCDVTISTITSSLPDHGGAHLHDQIGDNIGDNLAEIDLRAFASGDPKHNFANA